MQLFIDDHPDPGSCHRLRCRPSVRVERVQQGIPSPQNIRENPELGVAGRNRVGWTSESAVHALEYFLRGPIAAIHEMALRTFLGQRWHDCPCGVCAQRDLYSAFLGLHVHLCKGENGEVWRLDTETARTGWLVGESLLKKAVSDVVQTANGGLLPASFGVSKKPTRDRAVLS